MFHPLNSYWAAIDGQGQANMTLHNPGVSPDFTLYLQAAFLSSNASLMGATTTSALRLGL